MSNIDLHMIEVGLVRNLEDALLHSFDHLHKYSQANSISDLKWAVISIVQAGELLCNSLLIKESFRTEDLMKSGAFYAKSFNQKLLELLEQHCKQSLKLGDNEMRLLREAEQLAIIRNELMHRTLSLAADRVAYARAALATLLVFEQRYQRIAFPECDWEESKIDHVAVSLLPWLSGEKAQFFKTANEYLKESGIAYGHLNCPVCGTNFVNNETCRVCRTSLQIYKCSACEYEGYEMVQEIDFLLDCLDCGSCA